jgi:hypothetical protein
MLDNNRKGDPMRSLKQLTPSWVKSFAYRMTWKYRQATWRSRSLPNFIIIGAQRSGTTSLYSYLGQHPQLLPAYLKEVHFFDGGLNSNVDNYEKGQAWYRSHFPLRRDVGAQSKTFESSPLYIFNPLTPSRIFDLIPEVKIIAVLRNPTERAISHYFLEKKFGYESLSINVALWEEEKRLESVIEGKDYKNDIFIRHSYKSRGLYKEQIQRFLECFSRQQIFILSSEELFREPNITLERLFEFVGVDKGFKVKDLTPRNVARNRVDVDSKVYEYLNDYFRPHNHALYELVGKNFGWDNGAV